MSQPCGHLDDAEEESLARFSLDSREGPPRDQHIEAMALYERALSLDPDCFEAHFNLGNVHHDLSRFEDALASYREAVSLNPSYPEAHFYLAVTLEKMGRSPEARPHWRLYRELAPQGEWVELAKEFE